MPGDHRQGSRELSPYSARRALTMGKDANDSPCPRRRSRSRDGARDANVREGSHRSREERPVTSRRRSRSRSSQRKPRDAPKEASSTEPRDRPSKDDREASPEPFRRPKDRDRERRRDGSRDRRRDDSRDRRRDRSRDRRRDGSRDRRRERSRDRRRDRSRDRRKDQRSRDRKRRSRSPASHRSPKRQHRRDRDRDHRSPSTSTSPPPRSRKPLPSQEVSFRGLDDSAQPPTKYGGAPPEREKPNFKPTGLLAKEANKVEGTKISLKYHEPPEARKPPPSSPWTLTIFKGDEHLGNIELGSQSCWLLGRAREVADIVLEHPSSSSQHAAIQFRYITKNVEDEYGVRKVKGKVKPYVIDLESSNGTVLNDEDVEPGRYFELRDKDILRFAGSEREYVVMLPKV